MPNFKIILFPLPQNDNLHTLTFGFVISLKNNVGDHLFLGNMFKFFIRDLLRMKNMVAVDPEVGAWWVPLAPHVGFSIRCMLSKHGKCRHSEFKLCVKLYAVLSSCLDLLEAQSIALEVIQ